MTQKLSLPGTSDPLIARLVFQWTDLLDWFELPEERRADVVDTLLSKVAPKILECRKLVGSLQSDFEAIEQTGTRETALKDLKAHALSLSRIAGQALDDFSGVFRNLLGRAAPHRNLAAIARWAKVRFGSSDPVSNRLADLPLRRVRRISDACVRVATEGSRKTAGGTDLTENVGERARSAAASIAIDLKSFEDELIVYIEDALVAALGHVQTRAQVVLAEIPEAQRNSDVPVRFRAMVEDATGKLVPAGRITREGNVVPELQRLLQQGRGKPIIATKYGGEWFVAAGSKLYHSSRWKNFHDFLGYYIKDILGGEWANLELKKPRPERHPLMLWYEDVVRYTNKHLETGKRAPMTSLPAAYMGLAYNLYLISHNNGKVHEALIRRLKHRDQFFGAYFETVVAGIMVRAGFDIELEDESDVSTKHCEFTATHRESGQKLSVEAKMRNSKQQPPQIRWLLGAALKKKANHRRLVFIEVNDEQCAGESQKKLLLDLLASVRGKESDLLVDGQPAPPAYLVVVNNPPATLDRPHTYGYMVEGFKMPDFRVEGTHASLREALDARKRHVAMFALVDSLRIFNRIPVTFDGEIEAFAEAPPRGRLILGDRYKIQTPQGDVSGQLTQAVVMPSERAAYCILTENGNNQMTVVPLSDQEIQAYHESPRTFFGREEGETRIEDPLKLYDWFYESYKHNTKEHLLRLLTEMGAKDTTVLESLTQERLAEIFAERTTEAVAIQTGLIKPMGGLSPGAP